MIHLNKGIHLFRTFLIIPLLISCSETAELPGNNDTDKYTLSQDVLWASPGGFDLTMDIYTPLSGKDSYPVVLIFHGGGWLINDKSIMDQMAKYLATNSEYVICNVDYRLLVDSDNSVTLNQVVEDAFGAVLWAKENIAEYAGDGSKIAVTGDSAGAHMSAMIVNLGYRLSSDAYSEQSPGFKPSYLPPGKTAEQVAAEGGLSVQAAILSYGLYDVQLSSEEGFEKSTNVFWLLAGSWGRGLFGDEFNVADNPALYKGVSPMHNIPLDTVRTLPPQLLTVGSDDFLTSPESVKLYADTLQSSGHSVEYWEYEGRGHAFLDSGSGGILKADFAANAPEALDVMINFLDGVFYVNQ